MMHNRQQRRPYYIIDREINIFALVKSGCESVRVLMVLSGGLSSHDSNTADLENFHVRISRLRPVKTTTTDARCDQISENCNGADYPIINNNRASHIIQMWEGTGPGT